MASSEHRYTFSRRAFIMVCGKTVLMSTLIGRLYYLQFVKGVHYKTLADDNRLKMQFLSPQRGLLLDVTGKPLCINKTMFKAFLIPEESENWQEALMSAQTLLKLSDREVEITHTQIKQRQKFMAIDLKESLDWDEVSALSLSLPDMPGVRVEQGSRRHYPFGPVFAHVIGYVRRPALGDEVAHPFVRLPDYRMGHTGIEKTYESALRGTAGVQEVEVNVRNRPIRTLSKVAPKVGDSQTLTINHDIQQYVHTALSAFESATAVVLNVKTGAVEAMVSTPSFDPNMFVEGIAHKSWNALLTHPHRPLTFKAIQGLYPPASTFKMVTALAALKKGVLNLNQTFHCNGKFPFGSHTFHCWRKTGHGQMDLVQAIAQSCDTFFYHLAEKVGVDDIAKTARLLGFGALSGLDLHGERPGLVPDKNWKKTQLKLPWYKGETINLAIGQGYLQVSPVQLAIMTARLATGREVIPCLLREEAQENAQHPFQELPFEAQHLGKIRLGMREVIHGAMGTVHQLNNTRPFMAGKTGTAQVRRISMEERLKGVRHNSILPWHLRDHALYVGFSSPEDPRYAVAVVIEHGGGGSRVAAPVGIDILKYAMQKGYDYDRE